MDTTNGFGALRVEIIGLATILGMYHARLKTFELRPIVKTLTSIERRFYREIKKDVGLQSSSIGYFLHVCKDTSKIQKLSMVHQSNILSRLY